VDVLNGDLEQIDLNLKAMLDKLIQDGKALKKLHENVSIICSVDFCGDLGLSFSPSLSIDEI
jgi:hypothetical protein